jgi:CYTH domain-containing protein
MGKEIERKFLVQGQAWRSLAEGTVYRQGYLSTEKERVVRVRTIGDTGFLTIKGITVGSTRLEYEYPIPVTDADEMLDGLCERPLIEKTRYKIESGGHTWEIDEFGGENQGLVVAEVELVAESEAVDLPDWIGEEVTADSRYFNSNLIAHPFTTW